MNKEELCSEICNLVQEKMGSDYFVEITTTKKLNNIECTGICVHSKNLNISPIIYLEDLYKIHNNGTSINNLVDQIIKTYWEYEPKENIDIGFLEDYEKAKNNIRMRLVNRKLNSELLKTVPHVIFLDLAVLFYYEYEEFMGNLASILIKEELLKKWKVELEDVYKNALRMAQRVSEYNISSMLEILKKMYPEGSSEFDNLSAVDEGSFKDMMYVMTNKKMMFGAVCMLNNAALKSFADNINSNFYILPSSVHELILLPDRYEDGICDTNMCEELADMVRIINDTTIEPKEILSYSIYYFDREKGIVSLAKPCLE